MRTTVNLHWVGSSSTTVSGYQIYWTNGWTSSYVTIPKNTASDISLVLDLQRGSLYEFSVAPFDTAGNVGIKTVIHHAYVV